jgi:hypothetical protein
MTMNPQPRRPFTAADFATPLAAPTARIPVADLLPT